MANPNVASFPYAAPTDDTLTVASDNAHSALTADITDSATSIAVADASVFQVPCIVVIDSEIILARSKSTNTFTNCVRGFAGSSAAAHTDATDVFGYIVAYQHNQLAAEVKSVGSYIFNQDFSGFKRTENLVSYSEDFSQGYWAKSSGVTVSASSETLPNGSVGMELLEGTSSGVNQISGVPSGVVIGTTYSFSVYVKYDSSQWMLIGQNLAGTEQRWAWFDVQNGVLGNLGALVTAAAIVPVGDGWYRCVIITACTSDSNKSFGIALASANGTKTYLGTATNMNVICGAQIRTGTMDDELTYVKTTGTTFSLTGGGDLILDEGDLS